MAKLDYGPAIELLKGAHTVAICGHVNPDGDALGSVLALTCALRSAGYQVTPLLATRERPHLYDFLYAYEDLTPACEYGAVPDVFISVDVPSIQRTGDGVYVFNRACKTIAIDHHQGPADFANVNLVDDRAAAAGMLVWDFIEQAGIERTPDIATCCYTALVTDTGRFQFQNADPDALKAAASMAEAGASPSEISRQVYQRRSMAALKLNSLVIDRMNLICDGRAVISWVREKDFAELGATKDDGESLIDTIRQLDGIEVAVMLREQGPIVRGSIRSKTDRDVAAIAEKMNGGGHKAAAGFTIKGRLENAYDQVVDLLSESFAQTPVARETLDAEVTRTTVFRRIGEER
ncbi:MAG: bifunctional oligoribonuclease/PAP phosphatase NrnA [Coriobacteriales bacterium]|nr:bifunctional oligoribonuclease/PAP phosphatase NrnA [Coriobacteriales bacterium]